MAWSKARRSKADRPPSAGPLLITGGSGYLGSHLVRQALTCWHVMATSYSHDLAVPGVQSTRLDVRDAGAVLGLMTKIRPAVVIHTAIDTVSTESMQAVIVDGTRNVAGAASSTGAHLIHISTDMVFDGEHAPYSPGDPPEPITPYGRAKAEAEAIVTHVSPEAAIVRTSLIYGFAPIDPRTLWVLRSVQQHLPITLFTDEVRSPVWVDQLGAALLELAAHRLPGIWHLAGPQALDRYAFGIKLARAFGLEPAGITPGLSRGSGLARPRDLTLDVESSQRRLHSPFWEVDRVLERLGARPNGPATL